MDGGREGGRETVTKSVLCWCVRIPASSWIAWNRICRPVGSADYTHPTHTCEIPPFSFLCVAFLPRLAQGSILGPQQQFLIVSTPHPPAPTRRTSIHTAVCRVVSCLVRQENERRFHALPSADFIRAELMARQNRYHLYLCTQPHTQTHTQREREHDKKQVSLSSPSLFLCPLPLSFSVFRCRQPSSTAAHLPQILARYTHPSIHPSLHFDVC